MAEDKTPVIVVELSNEDYAELYGRICDLVERNYQGYPLDDDELGLTSDQAREVASQDLRPGRCGPGQACRRRRAARVDGRG